MFQHQQQTRRWRHRQHASIYDTLPGSCIDLHTSSRHQTAHFVLQMHMFSEQYNHTIEFTTNRIIDSSEIDS